jgi:ribonuclease PH
MIVERDSTDFSREISAYVKEAIESSICLDLYPQSAVTIYIKILQCGTSIHAVLPAAITVSSLACQKAGIKIKDKVIGVSLAISESGDYIINPSDAQASSRPSATIAMWEGSRQVSFLHVTGKLNGGEDLIDSIVNVADSAVTEISNTCSSL